MYQSGKSYYDELEKKHGKKEARKQVEFYLGMNVFDDDEEHQFCRELRRELYKRKK